MDTGLHHGAVLLLVVPRFLWEHRPCLYAAVAEGLERPSTDELGCSGWHVCTEPYALRAGYKFFSLLIVNKLFSLIGLKNKCNLYKIGRKTRSVRTDWSPSSLAVDEIFIWSSATTRGRLGSRLGSSGRRDLSCVCSEILR